MCMLTQEWILEQHGLDGEKHKMRIKYLFYKIVRCFQIIQPRSILGIT